MRSVAVALVIVLAATGLGIAATPKIGTRATPAVDPALWPALALHRPARKIPAPPFEAIDLAGMPVSLGAFRGRVVLLYFWTSW